MKYKVDFRSKVIFIRLKIVEKSCLSVLKGIFYKYLLLN